MDMAEKDKVEYERLRSFDRTPLLELDEIIKRKIQQEAEQKARELEEKLMKKRKKQKKRLLQMQQQQNQ